MAQSFVPNRPLNPHGRVEDLVNIIWKRSVITQRVESDRY